MLRRKKGKRRGMAKRVLHRWIISKAGVLDQALTRALFQPTKAEQITRKRAPRSSIYSTDEWKRLRFDALAASPRCLLCGASPEIGAVLNVDHVKPVATHPHLALDPSNLQVLCASCNWGKGNKHGDFRKPIKGQ